MARLDDVQLKFVESMQDAMDFMSWLMHEPHANGAVGIDTETSDLSPEHGRVRLIQFGDLKTGWAMDWELWRGLAVEAIHRWQGQWVFHNSKFDIRHISSDMGWKVNDWPWHRTHDTMGMAHILDSQRPKGLKPLAMSKVDTRAGASQADLSEGMAANGWDWDTVPAHFPPYWQYGALDPVLTAHLYDIMWPKISGQYAALYDVEMGSIRVTAKMEERGVRVDIGYSVNKAAQLREYEHSVHEYLVQNFGLDNPTRMGLIRYFTDKGVELPPVYTEKGAQKMDKYVLQLLAAEGRPEPELILNMRKADKMAGTYLENFPRFADKNGFLHPSINPMAARTGRMSITDPALQTLPRKDPLVRTAFIPREGHALMSIDADQIEARLTAHFSEDPGLIAAFNSGEDFFCVIATLLFGYTVTKGMQERDLVKGVVYGKIYGAGVPKMAETAGVPVEQIARVNDLFDVTFANVKSLQRTVMEGKEDGRGYVTTPYGRRLLADRGKEYALTNYLIQCHASEVLKYKIVQLDAALPDEVQMILPIHDEIFFDVPVEMVEEQKALAVEVLNQSENYKVPITWGADIMWGNWGDKYRKAA